ncbi:hypothetical protein BG011_009324 [Mortierella polycephala]|uniref:Uncharacterized protein n=1 Tax=Mortierella polycephala TaxID=41804 RepID=A0A9P6TWD6_9FUNG|nr:hypothetical protein BG011_009324 [Mortierella polycephala]
MDLELSECAEQAALLLTPDLLAMAMVLILLLYPSASCCCFGPTHSDQDLDQEQEQELSYLEHDLEDGQGSEGTLYPHHDHDHHQQRGDAEKQAFQHSGTQQSIDDTHTTTTTPVATATNTAVALAIAQDEKDQKRKRRNLRLYIVIRVAFSLGLAVLILYWPASGLQPPVGYLPNLTDIHRTSGTKRAPSGHSSSTHPGGPGVSVRDDDWCSLAEAFGDNQSAGVYCRVNAIRPAIAYIWASLTVLELLLAFMALDFSSRKWNKNRQHWEGAEVSGFGDEAEQQQQHDQQYRQQDAIENTHHHQQQQAIIEDGAGVGYGGVVSSNSSHGRIVYNNG